MTSQHDIEKLNRDNFRASLEAIARPGELQSVTPLFGSGLLAMASVLLYAEVSYCYEGNLDFQLIRAICGAHSVSGAKADYLFFDAVDNHCLENVKVGTPESPESGATLIFACHSLRDRGVKIRLSGPGIKEIHESTLPVKKEFIALLQQKNESFPMGVDIFFVSDDNQLFGLPRTTRIEVIV